MGHQPSTEMVQAGQHTVLGSDKNTVVNTVDTLRRLTFYRMLLALPSSRKRGKLERTAWCAFFSPVHRVAVSGGAMVTVQVYRINYPKWCAGAAVRTCTSGTLRLSIV